MAEPARKHTRKQAPARNALPATDRAALRTGADLTAGGGGRPSPAPIFMCRCGYMASPPPSQCPVCGRNAAARAPSDKAAPCPSGSDHRRRPGKVGSCGGELPVCPEADGVGERADDSRERPAPRYDLASCDCCDQRRPACEVTGTDTGPSVCDECRETCARLEPQGCCLEDHTADTCVDCGATLCAELVSYDPGTGEQLHEARDYCAVCGDVPAIPPAAAVGPRAVGGQAAASYDFDAPGYSGADVEI